MTRIPVYFMPGMAASSSIFEKIKLPVDQFEVFLLEWIQPLPQESLKSYAMRMAKNVTHQNQPAALWEPSSPNRLLTMTAPLDPDDENERRRDPT